MKKINSFEINKIYHITLDTVEFEDSAYQLDYKNFNKNDFIHIHLIDREQNIESNLIIPFKNLINDNMYYHNGINVYYFKYDNIQKIFVKKWGI